MQTYILRVYRTRPAETQSTSGIIEDVSSAQKIPFHGLDDLLTLLTDSIGRYRLEHADLASRELTLTDSVVMV